MTPSTTAALLVVSAGIVLLLPARRREAGRRRRSLSLRPAGLSPVGLLAWVGAAAAAAAGLFLLTGVVALALAALVAVLALPALMERRRRSATEAARRKSWPQVLDMLVSAMRSGEPLGAALASVCDRAPLALLPSLTQLTRDLRHGVDFDSATLLLARDLGDPISARVVAVLNLARRAGGRAATDIMADLARHVRAELAAEKEVVARQSWVVASARLAAAAPWVMLCLTALRPAGLEAFRSPAGNVVLAVAGLMTLLGYLLAMRIGTPREMRQEGAR